MTVSQSEQSLSSSSSFGGAALEVDPTCESSTEKGGKTAGEATAPGKSPLRVLHVYSGNLFGGIERTFLTYVARPEPSVWQPEFALCFDGQLREGLSTAGGVHHDLGPVRVREPWTVARARRRLRALLAARTYDVIVSHSAWVQSVFGAVIRESPALFVFYLHDIPSGTHLLERLAKRVIPDLVMCNSHFTSGQASRMYPGIPAVTSYPAVGAGAQTDAHDAASRRALRASLATAEDDVVIVQASRMQEWKGHGLLVESLAQVNVSTPWTCWIAGGPQRPEETRYFEGLKARARELGIAGRIRFLGHRRDVSTLFAAADMFCQPNVAPEPFGVVFIEALAAGLPVVSTRMGGAMEIIDETCGVLVESEPDAVGAAIGRLVESPALRARLGASGPSRARALTDPSRQVRGMVEQFRARRVHHDAQAVVLPAGTCDAPIRRLVARVVRDASSAPYDTVVDLGSGAGHMAKHLEGAYRNYVGCDSATRRPTADAPKTRFVATDLDGARLPLADASADLVLAVQTIDALEEPRALFREMVRIARPGARIVVTASNRSSLANRLSKLARETIRARRTTDNARGNEGTLVEADLRSLAEAHDLERIAVHYTNRGRVPLTRRRWPAELGFSGTWFSDHVLLTAVKPANASVPVTATSTSTSGATSGTRGDV